MASGDSFHDLIQRSFTIHEAAALGIEPRALRMADVRETSRGIFEPASGPGVGVLDRVRTQLSVQPDAWGSHRTAATIHGLWLPPSLDEHAQLHLSKPTHLPRIRRPGIVGHRVRILPGEVIQVQGLWVSSPARTWLDLAAEMTPATLIALGDQLIRQPRAGFEGRTTPYSTRAILLDLLRAHPKVKGVGRCKDALADMRVGSDSVPETLLRLSLVAHGFPEPDLQILLDPSDPYSPSADQGYRNLKIALQYEGQHHELAEQQAKDRWRDARFARSGWATIHVVAADLADDFIRVRRELSVLIRKRAA
ncbi:hypothetical protein [Sinomonas albida]|uniref:hypothetical protein n=1 Tax=Sinomonas albida TaxID=369942 RepID=UPI0010A80564|nr:hypothetical protein [Sinomonas albida]